MTPQLMIDTEIHGNTKVSDSDIFFIEEQLNSIDAEIVRLKSKKQGVLNNFNITIGHYKKKLKALRA